VSTGGDDFDRTVCDNNIIYCCDVFSVDGFDEFANVNLVFWVSGRHDDETRIVAIDVFVLRVHVQVLFCELYEMGAVDCD